MNLQKSFTNALGRFQAYQASAGALCRLYEAIKATLKASGRVSLMSKRYNAFSCMTEPFKLKGNS